MASRAEAVIPAAQSWPWGHSRPRRLLSALAPAVTAPGAGVSPHGPEGCAGESPAPQQSPARPELTCSKAGSSESFSRALFDSKHACSQRCIQLPNWFNSIQYSNEPCQARRALLEASSPLTKCQSMQNRHRGIIAYDRAWAFACTAYFIIWASVCYPVSGFCAYQLCL